MSGSFKMVQRKDDGEVAREIEPRLADNAMVALALLVAESEPSQKELMIRLVLNLLAEDAP